MREDVLNQETAVLVTMEEPPKFARLVSAWEEGGHAGNLAPGECCYSGSPERTAEQREEFARYVRDIGYQSDLERTGQRPVVSLQLTPPHGIPAVGRGTGAIHVTRRARDIIEQTSPLPALSPPAEMVEHEDPPGGE